MAASRAQQLCIPGLISGLGLALGLLLGVALGLEAGNNIWPRGFTQPSAEDLNVAGTALIAEPCGNSDERMHTHTRARVRMTRQTGTYKGAECSVLVRPSDSQKKPRPWAARGLLKKK